MRKRFNNKPQTRVRLVYKEENGLPISYLHLDKSEAQKALKIIEELDNYDNWVLGQRLARKLKMDRVTFVRVVSKIAGAIYIDVKHNGAYQKLIESKPLILVRREIVNGKVIRGFVGGYRTPPIYVKKARKISNSNIAMHSIPSESSAIPNEEQKTNRLTEYPLGKPKNRRLI